MNNGKLLLVTEVLRSNCRDGGFYLQHLPGELLRMLEALVEPEWDFTELRRLLDEAEQLNVLESRDLPPGHYHELRRRVANVPLWYGAALEAVQTLEAHINGLQQETRAAIEKSFRLDRENAALRAQLARKDARLRELETGIAPPTASVEEAGRKWLVTFADSSAECRDSIQIRTLALLLGSTPEADCSTRWLYEAARGESSASPVEDSEAGDFNAETADEKSYASRIGDINVEGLRITDRRTALRGDPEKAAMAQRLYNDRTNSIDDICKALGISRATLYRYIDTKLDTQQRPAEEVSPS